jgi:hypothetical protein
MEEGRLALSKAEGGEGEKGLKIPLTFYPLPQGERKFGKRR